MVLCLSLSTRLHVAQFVFIFRWVGSHHIPDINTLQLLVTFAYSVCDIIKQHQQPENKVFLERVALG